MAPGIEGAAMSPIRSILVHLDGTARAEVRLRLAHQLANEHRAMLSVQFAVAPMVMPVPVGGGMAAIPVPDDIDVGHRESARQLFERTMARDACTWHESAGEPPARSFVHRALLADLLVLGQRDPDDASGFDVPADFVEEVLMGSGRPALVVPYAGDFRSLPETVLIAWKPTREAARALAGALPFLQRARQVHVVCSGNDDVDERQAMAEVGLYLRWHGVGSVTEHLGLDDADAGNALLSLAADTGAELLVMGCYGHGRTRELLLGGASRTVLQAMTLPVLMAH
jgi:nucleotide-binding universal stress UspA family protein